MLSRWERAYQALKLPKKRSASSRAGSAWSARVTGTDRRILEICCGRGNGLRAWQSSASHTRLASISHRGWSRNTGPGVAVIGDARALPLPDASRDVAVVQGGLHHLFTSADVERTWGKCARSGPQRPDRDRRALADAISVASCTSSSEQAARRLSVKVDALATMIEEERETYERWLNAPRTHLGLIPRHVVPHSLKRRWGKLVLVGSPVEPVSDGRLNSRSAPNRPAESEAGRGSVVMPCLNEHETVGTCVTKAWRRSPAGISRRSHRRGQRQHRWLDRDRRGRWAPASCPGAPLATATR